MNYCDTCIHREVCGEEDAREPAVTFCAERIEPCEDCISRQAVDTLVDELARAISDERCCISRGRSTATIMRDIRHLPPVTPAEDVADTDVGKMPCKDAISRAELVRKLNAWDHNVNAISNYVWKVIRELPSVTLQPKVGRWYKKPHEICYTCDQCRTTNASGVKYNFCPHCGACMTGAEGSEEE